MLQQGTLFCDEQLPQLMNLRLLSQPCYFTNTTTPSPSLGVFEEKLHVVLRDMALWVILVVGGWLD